VIIYIFLDKDSRWYTNRVMSPATKKKMLLFAEVCMIVLILLLLCAIWLPAMVGVRPGVERPAN
jgi:hypothetical protein